MAASTDFRAPRRIALLSIHPKYASAILAGTKQVEFRKRFPPTIEYVVIYATHPVSRIVGHFSISHFTTGTPHALWNQYADVGGIDRTAYFNYYRGHAKAVGIHVKTVTILQIPQPLRTLVPNGVPPQSFTYLPDHTLELLRSDVGNRKAA